jgi:hypothetical protein
MHAPARFGYIHGMAGRTGSANLPLHGGHAPRYLFERMARLAPEIVQIIVMEHGRDEFLRRIADPHWFQAFGCVLGFDWHSSGVTTTVCGALKQGLAPRADELGIYVAGGKGRASLQTPRELERFAGQLGLDGARLAYNSRMAAKVDSAAVQDGFAIYQHSFFLTADGKWAVVQQGMNEGTGMARRYHWLGERVEDFVREPHAAIASERATQTVLNFVATESGGARSAIAELARLEPHTVERDVDRIAALHMPVRHWVDVKKDINPKHLHKVMLSTYEAAPHDFEALLALKGVGPAALRALALLAEVMHGAPTSTRDPARFSFAHGGKDGHPFPVDRRTYDGSIAYLRDAVAKAKIGNGEQLKALRRLAAWERGA